jgi:hypothetical protein
VKRLPAQPLGVLVVRPELHELVLEDGRAARLDSYHRHAGADLVAQAVEDPPQVRLGQVEHPVVVERPAAAEVAARDRDVEARLLERLDRGDSDLGLEVVREGVGPDQHAPAAGPVARRSPGEPVLQRHRRERRDLPPRVDARRRLEPGSVREQVRERGRLRPNARGLVDQPEGVGGARPKAARIALREELGLQRGQVDTDRAVVRAPLAREAEVERLLDLVGAPGLELLAVQHLPEQPRPPARRVLLLARDHEARAHHAAARPPALADPDAASGRVNQAASVALKGEVGLHRRRRVARAEPQVRGDRVGVDDLAGVHLPARVPDRLELAESADQLIAEHLRQELGLRLAVAVLARDRAAMRDDQLGGLV